MNPLTIAASLATVVGTPLLLGTPAPVEAQEQGAPKLVVLMAVDQLRGDLLLRYEEGFQGGLARLMNGGLYFTHATHDHAQTSTAPGHTTIGSGVYPTRHGIVGNEWTEFASDGSRQSVYAMRDVQAPILGHDELEGRSPANMLRDGLADWMQDASDETRIVSISKKDRAAIGLASRAQGEVYWLHPNSGRFVTSRYYQYHYPDWIERFNDEVMPGVFSDTIWVNEAPEELRRLARPDRAAREADGVHTTFPHRLSEEIVGYPTLGPNGWRMATPAPDRAVLLAATRAVEELELGQRSGRDFLAVSLSQTDAIGHAYGPRSQEQLDNLLRIDRHLGVFLDELDRMVGEGNWVLAFTADHGVADLPEFFEPPVDRMDRGRQREFFGVVQRMIADGLRGADLVRALQGRLPDEPEVDRVVSFQEVMAPRDSVATLYGRSHNMNRRTSLLNPLPVYVNMKPGVLLQPTGTTHGSPQYYDRWVPLIFYGPGIAARRDDGPASTVDIAPTLADLVGVPYPEDLDGLALIGGRR